MDGMGWVVNGAPFSFFFSLPPLSALKLGFWRTPPKSAKTVAADPATVSLVEAAREWLRLVLQTSLAGRLLVAEWFRPLNKSTK